MSTADTLSDHIFSSFSRVIYTVVVVYLQVALTPTGAVVWIHTLRALSHLQYVICCFWACSDYVAHTYTAPFGYICTGVWLNPDIRSRCLVQMYQPGAFLIGSTTKTRQQTNMQ